jgi:hypothetical protein
MSQSYQRRNSPLERCTQKAFASIFDVWGAHVMLELMWFARNFMMLSAMGSFGSVSCRLSWWKPQEDALQTSLALFVEFSGLQLLLQWVWFVNLEQWAWLPSRKYDSSISAEHAFVLWSKTRVHEHYAQIFLVMYLLVLWATLSWFVNTLQVIVS